MKIESSQIYHAVLAGVVMAYRVNLPEGAKEDLGGWFGSLRDLDSSEDELPIHELLSALETAGDAHTGSRYYQSGAGEQKSLIVAREALRAMVELHRWRQIAAQRAA